MRMQEEACETGRADSVILPPGLSRQKCSQHVRISNGAHQPNQLRGGSLITAKACENQHPFCKVPEEASRTDALLFILLREMITNPVASQLHVRSFFVCGLVHL